MILEGTRVCNIDKLMKDTTARAELDINIGSTVSQAKNKVKTLGRRLLLQDMLRRAHVSIDQQQLVEGSRQPRRRYLHPLRTAQRAIAWS